MTYKIITVPYSEVSLTTERKLGKYPLQIQTSSPLKALEQLVALINDDYIDTENNKLYLVVDKN